MTRITSGLQVGRQVVLAHLDEPLPTNRPSNQGPGPGLEGWSRLARSIRAGAADDPGLGYHRPEGHVGQPGIAQGRLPELR